MAANTLTLWRAQPLSLPLELCENLFYDAVFLKTTALKSDCGSPDEHLLDAVILPTLFFIRPVVFG